MFKPFTAFYSDGYKVGHKLMLAPGTTRVYGTGIPRSLKYLPPIKKVISFGQQLALRWLHDEFKENFFKASVEDALQFGKDMSLYLGMDYDASHFIELYKLGYLPMRYQALPEGIETNPNIPHTTFINTVDGFGWLTLYLETILSCLTWKPQTAATIALHYRRKAVEWTMKTNPEQDFLIPFMCHDFSARGLNPHDMVSVGLGHATSFLGSDTIITIPAARYYYDEPKDKVCIYSVNASEHSVTCTGIFYYKNLLEAGQLDDVIKEYYSFDAPSEGSVDKPDYLAIAEYCNLRDWLNRFPKGILSYVCDTFNTWKLITHILPRLKKQILAREGKLVVRPDSGNPVDIVCGLNSKMLTEEYRKNNLNSDEFIAEYTGKSIDEVKGVVELLYDIFGGTKSSTGYKVLNSHIGCIYGDSINFQRQEEMYTRLAEKGFAATNILLGVGSFTYSMLTRDSTGYAIKGAWFEIGGKNPDNIGYAWKHGYNIYKDPITDDGTKRSLKGFQFVYLDKDGECQVEGEVSEEKAFSEDNILKTIYLDGKFYNQTTLTEIREKINNLK